jgi:AraC-like DNA-binding protein
MCRDLAEMLIVEIIRSARGIITGHSRQETPESPNDEANMHMAMDFLARSDVGFSLENAASVAGLSTYHFIRSFKKQTGMTPYQFYIRTKVERAKVLLRRRLKLICPGPSA